MGNKRLFENFSDYWYYARSLSENQRKIIFKILPAEEKNSLDESYRNDGWNDVFYRNEIDKKIDEIKKDYGYDLVDVKSKLLKGKSIYMSTKLWKIIKEQMGQYRPEAVGFIMEGVSSIPCKANKEVSLLVHENFNNNQE